MSSSTSFSSAGASPAVAPARARAPHTSAWLKAALWLLATAGSVWLAGIYLSWATDRYDFSERKAQESLAFHDQDLDVLYFGNSVVLEGVDPQPIDAALHIKSYNFALGGSTLLESEIQLRHYLEHNHRPRLIALGVYPNQLHESHGVHPVVYFALSPQLRALYQERIQGTAIEPVDRSYEVFNRVPAYRYRNTVDAVIKAALTREDVRPHFVQGHAYVEFSRASGAMRAHDAEFDARQFDSFLAFCDAQAIPVLVFEPPNSPGYSAGTRNREPVLANIGAVMARHPNARFVSYDAESADYAPAEWLNLNHLNHRGADKFSLRLSARIAEALHSSAGE